MDLHINGYRNLLNFDYSIADNKVNFLFGISGSGKSSISRALNLEDVDFNKSVNFAGNQEINVNGSNAVDFKISIFDENQMSNYIFGQDVNKNLFSVIIDDDNEFIKAREEIDALLNGLNNELVSTARVFEGLKGIQSSIGSTLNKDGNLKATSSIVKLRNSFNAISNRRTFKEIAQIEQSKFEWICNGASLISNEDSKCPFCNKKLSRKRLNKINDYIAFDLKSMKNLGSASIQLRDYGIGDFAYTKSGIDNLVADLVNVGKAIVNYENLKIELDKFYTGELRYELIKPFPISDELVKFFPTIKPVVIKLNRSIESVKSKTLKAQANTAKILSKKLRNINSIICSLGIPYVLVAKYSKSTITEYKLQLKKEINAIDRKKSLSNGEKNILSLIFFLIDSKSRESDLIIIDDPVSSYDEYRRKTIFDTILNKLKGKTVLVLSHDDVFAKCAIIENRFKSQLGPINYLENFGNMIKTTEISKTDFGKFDDFLVENCKSLSQYYQTIINLRMLYEGRYNSYAYQYLSAILHGVSKNSLDQMLLEKGLIESEVISKIGSEFQISLRMFDEIYYQNIDSSNYSFFEKAILLREKCRKNNGIENYKDIKYELDNLIHLNSKLNICLNPFKFTFCSQYAYDLVTSSTQRLITIEY